MKFRSENKSMRLRINQVGLERLHQRARWEASTKLLSEDGKSTEGEFIYAVTVDRDGGATRCRIEPSFIMLILHPDDLAALSQPGSEGIYLRRESTLDSGEIHRFMAYLELDRPVKKRRRPEAWMDS